MNLDRAIKISHAQETGVTARDFPAPSQWLFSN